MPGQTAPSTISPSAASSRFNGGPDNCPAKHRTITVIICRQNGLQWRAGQLPGQTGLRVRTRRYVDRLQWRAGQLPGQTRTSQRLASVREVLQWRAGQLPGQTVKCPPSADVARQLQWRAGQLPGQTAGTRKRSWRRHTVLQWRAGQLPGQTGEFDAVDVDAAHASMEGRTIARPNSHRQDGVRRRHRASMEGRTIARPNRPRPGWAAVPHGSLQWRAGQLPGQTAHRASWSTPTTSLQWRAGQLPGQTSLLCVSKRNGFALQWRAGQLPGQTARPFWPV